MLKQVLTVVFLFNANAALACSGPGQQDLAYHLQAVNAVRAPAGLAPLTVSPGLNHIAQGHACDMASRRFFGHTSPDGRGLPHRIAALRAPETCRAAENIAKGQRSIPAVMRSWMGSDGHRRNILDPRLTHVGFGHAQGAHWVQVFGGPC